jgi:hypothetical protein
MSIEQTVTTKTAVDLAVSVTPDVVGNVLDTLISAGQSLNPAQGTIVAIVVAALVVIRMIWKKHKSTKREK